MIDRNKLREAIIKYAPTDKPYEKSEEFFLNVLSEFIKWEDCTDETYWTGDYDIVKVPICGEFFIFTHKECPYGWNILVRSNAKILRTNFLFDQDNDDC